MDDQTIHRSSTLGPDVKVAPDARIGPNCYLEGRTTIGSQTQLIGGVTLIGDASIGNDCVLEPGVTITNMPCSPEKLGAVVLGNGVRVGAGSVLASGITIGAAAQIGAGTIVTRNVPPYAIVRGNPAAIVGYVTSTTAQSPATTKRADDVVATGVNKCAVAGVQIHKFARIRDLRGDLSVGEFGRDVPFEPKRYFLVYDVPSAETRGEHAHRTCKQFLICVSGYVAVVVDDGAQRQEIELNAPNIGIYIPPRVWGIQYKYLPSSVLLVFTSHYYDPLDYIRDYNQFMKECGPLS